MHVHFPGLMLGLLERYWLQPSVILSTVAGGGLGLVLSYLSKLTGNSKIVKYTLLTVAVLAASYQVSVFPRILHSVLILS